jgi:hypothetical protein
MGQQKTVFSMGYVESGYKEESIGQDRTAVKPSVASRVSRDQPAGMSLGAEELN